MASAPHGFISESDFNSWVRKVRPHSAIAVCYPDPVGSPNMVDLGVDKGTHSRWVRALIVKDDDDRLGDPDTRITILKEKEQVSHEKALPPGVACRVAPL